jgi:hypothetical protein
MTAVSQRVLLLLGLASACVAGASAVLAMLRIDDHGRIGGPAMFLVLPGIGLILHVVLLVCCFRSSQVAVRARGMTWLLWIYPVAELVMVLLGCRASNVIYHTFNVGFGGLTPPIVGFEYTLYLLVCFILSAVAIFKGLR